MVKPDGVRKGLTGEVIRRLEQRDLKIVALRMFQPTREAIDEHYPKDNEWMKRVGEKTLATYHKYGIDPIAEVGTEDPLEIGRAVRGWILDYMVSAPLVKMVVQGVHAIDMVRKIVGHTIPSVAEMGTIRGDFSADSPALANKERRAVQNLVHASETPQEAEHEIAFWFGDDTLLGYGRYGVDN